MRFSKMVTAALVSLFFQASIARAQQATPTFNILTRMTMIESHYGRGTTFSIDVDHREYWITAKHILTGAKHPPYGAVTSKSVLLSILDPTAQGPERWLPVNFSVIDAGKDIDIVILAPPNPLLKNPLPSIPASDSALIGGDCAFLGFPYGGGWRGRFDNGQSYWMPFIKHCGLSALPDVEPKFMVLDGINNEGFSGGPVIYKTGPEQQVLAVISGYLQEPTDVFASATTKKVPAKTSEPSKPVRRLRVNLNSGFIIAYSISYAMDAIHRNPIGPLR
jgi:hypothetical protein